MALTGDVKSLLTGVSNIYRGSMPSTPDNVVCIYNSGGYERDSSGTEVEEPTFQIVVRNTDFDAAEALCNTIKDLLHGKSTTKFLNIFQQGDILPLGRDENNRTELSMNFRCYYRR